MPLEWGWELLLVQVVAEPLTNRLVVAEHQPVVPEVVTGDRTLGPVQVARLELALARVMLVALELADRRLVHH